jgi:Ni/Co efflux regulator RcnB
MRKLFKVLAVASLLVAGAATAQDQGPRPGDRGQRPGAGQGPNRPTDAGRGQNGGSRPPPDAGNGHGRPRPPPNQHRPQRPSPPPPPRPRPPQWGHRPPHHFLSGGHWRPSLRGPAYRYPPGFAYRRWATGAILPPLFLSGAYFYDNYAPLGLGPPPPGYRWVRYGPDLLLVNVVTGRVADVVDGAFY